jgi:regulator of protease activity HflC (stomatin/prohibitin superfamily)
MKKFVASLVVIFVLGIFGIIGYNVTHETIPAGYVGYVYDRTARADDNVIPGTSVINEARTGRIRINPVTQDVLTYPTTIVSENWTNESEGDSWNGTDMSMQIASQEGKNIDTDIYISVKPVDIEKIIKSFGTKKFDSIVNNDIYGLAKGKLSSVSQAYSVYDVQSSRTEIQQQVFNILSETLSDIYGVELVRFEIGTLILPADIQEKIDQKTQAQNEVELAKLERQKQDEINQQIVDEQKAQSEKEMLQRQAEADAKAYEITKAAEAQVTAQEAEVKIAELKVEQARLEKEAELEKQKSYTDEYFKDKELDVQKAAVAAINPTIKTIVTSGNGEGFEAIIGLKEILEQVG